MGQKQNKEAPQPPDTESNVEKTQGNMLKKETNDENRIELLWKKLRRYTSFIARQFLFIRLELKLKNKRKDLMVINLFV